MSKMREACKKQMLEPFRGRELDFEAGYQAAIAAVKEGGVRAYLCTVPAGVRAMSVEDFAEQPTHVQRNWAAGRHLFELPED